MDKLQKLRVGMQQAAGGICCLMAVSVFVGCGAAEKEVAGTTRVKASGKVEFDGKPLESGTVSFLHQDTGNIATCPVSDGEYACEAEEGPNPGPNAVTIMGTANGQPMWAAAWKGQATVGDGDFTQDFKVGATDVKPYDPAKAAGKNMDAGDTYDVGAE